MEEAAKALEISRTWTFSWLQKLVFCTLAEFFVTNAKLSSRQMCSGPQLPIFYNIAWTGLKARQLDKFVTQNNEVQPE